MTDTEASLGPEVPDQSLLVDDVAIPWRRRLTIVGAAVAALAAVAIGAIASTADEPSAVDAPLEVGGDGPGTTADPVVLADPDPTQPTPVVTAPPVVASTNPAPATTSQPTQTPRGTRTRVMEGPEGSYEVFFYAGDRCLEVRSGGVTFDRLLCGAGPAPSGSVLGDAVTISTPAARIFLAVAEPDVTEVLSRGARFFNGPEMRSAGMGGTRFLAARMGAEQSELRFFVGEHTVGGMQINGPGDRVYPRSELPLKTTAPFGVWPGYRKAGYTGLFLGGDQEIGFYDGPNGSRCALYRRLGGPSEAVIADRCLSIDAGHLQASTLHSTGDHEKTLGFIAFAVTDLVGATLEVEMPDGTRATMEEPPGDHAWPDEFADPAGTGFVARGQFVKAIRVPDGVKQVDFVLSVDGDEVERETINVPGR